MRLIVRLQLLMSLLFGCLAFSAAMVGAAFPSDELTFHVYRANQYDIYTLDVRSGIRRRLFPHLVSSAYPLWSPDGERVAFFANPPDLYIADANGGHPQPVADLAHSPTWMPDGMHLAYIRDNTVLIKDTRAPHEPPEILRIAEFQAYYSVAWSPDGSRIAYVTSTEREGTPNIFIFDLETGGSTWLARGESPAWSPDGMRIAYRASRLRIMVIPSQGGTPAYITDGFGPAWSPDGEWLALSRQQNAAIRLILRHLASGREYALVQDGLGNFAANWRPR